MNEQIKKEVLVTGSVEMKLTASQLRDKTVDKLKSRGPGQIGQLKKTVTVRIGPVSREEFMKRVLLTEKFLYDGEAPTELTEVLSKKLNDAAKALRSADALIILKDETIKILEADKKLLIAGQKLLAKSLEKATPKKRIPSVKNPRKNDFSVEEKKKK